MTALIIVITGASRGIGFELTKQALELGHRVIAGCRKPSLSLEIKDLRDTHGDKLKIIDLDVANEVSVAKFARNIGAEHVDILINNAGILNDGEDTSLTVTPAKILETLQTNTVGPVRMTQALLPLLRKSLSPRVANITCQIGSIEDNSSGGSLAYRMSKAALNMFTKTLAIEEPEMVVLALHPGWVQTNMGGKRAPLSAQASAEGLLRVIRGSSLKESGHFYSYSAKELPW